jgi:hypothetical protein
MNHLQLNLFEQTICQQIQNLAGKLSTTELKKTLQIGSHKLYRYAKKAGVTISTRQTVKEQKLAYLKAHKDDFIQDISKAINWPHGMVVAELKALGFTPKYKYCMERVEERGGVFEWSGRCVITGFYFEEV